MVTPESMLDTAGPRQIEARIAGHTHPGQRRTENQDNFLISDLSPPDQPLILRPDATGVPIHASVDVGRRGMLLVLADGMGGAAAGRLASSLACTFIQAELQEAWLGGVDGTPAGFTTCLREAVEKTNARIHLHAARNPETIGMGSTVTAAGVLDGVLYVAQVGDSRAYLARRGTATQITRDQSLVQNMIDAGALTPEEAEHSAHGNVILQALGVKSGIDVDLTYQVLRQGDVLVLCSDGLNRVVRPGEIAAAVDQIGDPGAICEALVGLANDRGGPDNVTVVAARFNGAGLVDAGPTDFVGRTVYADESLDGPLS